uniref:Uncharacterized protein n=1 Tax=Panagrolaimus superbus TaxID=310955 RepID=A0A914YR81_9BILA
MWMRRLNTLPHILKYCAPAADAKRGPGLSDPGPTLPHPVRWRGAARQAGQRTGQGSSGRRSDSHRPRLQGSAHLVRAGRTQRRPIHGGCGKADCGAAPTGRCRSYRAGD